MSDPAPGADAPESNVAEASEGPGEGATDAPTARDDAGRERPTWPLVGVLLAVLWLFVNAVPPEAGPVLGQFLIGLAFGLPVAYVSRRFYWPQTDPVRLLRAAPYMALYLLAFMRVLLVANLDVAYRVLSPRLPIEPAVIDLPLRVRSDVAITTIANSITLTPGTLTLDYDEERNALAIHAIDGRDPASVAAPIRRWEEYALVIFDEPLKPGDPVPARASAFDPEGGDPGGE